MKAGHYARPLLVQRSINVSVVCFGPDGKLLFEADSYKIGDTEIAELIGDTSDDYRFRVIAPDSSYARPHRGILNDEPR